MKLPYLLVPNELSDEAAAHIAELLHDLAIAFDNQYFAQIQRHYQELEQELERQLRDQSPRNDAQLELFEPHNWPF